MQTYDTIIIGGGSLGMAIAYRHATSFPKASVVIIDNEQGFAASRAAGAMLGCFGEVTKYTFATDANKKKFELMYAAHMQWSAWMKELEITAKEKIQHTPGTHVIMNTQGGELDDENFEAFLQALQKYNEPFTEIRPKDIQGLKPTALARTLRAVYINEGSVDSHQYLTVLKKACQKKGVQFINNMITKIIPTSSGYTLESKSEKLACEKVVLATGSYTTQLINDSKLDLAIMPVYAGAGFAMVLERAEGETFKNTIRTANRSGSCGLHLIPLTGQREYIGATNVVFGNPQHRANVGMVNFLTQCAIEQLNTSLFLSWVDEWRIGNRPVSLDTLPLIGQTKLAGLFIATGTYRDGFHCSPVIAQHIINEMQGGKRLIDKIFAPERKPIELFTQKESIKEYALQALSGAYEQWLTLPRQMNDAELLPLFEERAKNIYKKLNIKTALHPDILFYLTTSVQGRDEALDLKKYLKAKK